MKRYWLMKSDADVYSIKDLQKEKKTLWDGVRNYQARNFMMNDMNVGDEILFYHSLANPPGIAGLARVSKKAQADPTATDPKSKYFDSRSTLQNPRWYCIEVQFKKIFKNFISLETLKQKPALRFMLVLKKGQRLSVMPVQEKEFKYILKLAL